MTPGQALETTHRDTRRAGVAERTHEWYRANLGAALDGDLSADERADLWEHLAFCASCAAFRRTLERSVEATTSLPPVTAPASAKQRVLGSLP